MGISIWQLLIVLAIIVLIFGTKRLRGLGGDLGSAIKGFKSAVKEDEKDQKDAEFTPEIDQKSVEKGAEKTEQTTKSE